MFLSSPHSTMWTVTPHWVPNDSHTSSSVSSRQCLSHEDLVMITEAARTVRSTRVRTS